MKEKLLILSWGVYPSPTGSSVIVNNLSEGFEESELVLVGQEPSEIPKKKWEDFSKIKLYYLNVFPFDIRKGERYLRWLKLNSALNQLIKIIKKEKITRVLVIFPDEYFAWLGYRVSKKLSLPFSIWLHNSYLENRSGIFKVLAKYFQPKFFKSATPVFVMSAGLNNELSKQYPDIKFETLVHGFKVNLERHEAGEINKNKVKFLYSGSLNESCLDASIRLLNVLKRNKNYEINIFSGNPDSFKECGISGKNVKFHEFLPVDEFCQKLSEFDIMLLPHGIDGIRSAFEYKTIFPTRSIPLLFSNRPILAHSPKGSFLTDFLVENKCALVVTEKDENKLEEALETLINDFSLREKLIINARLAANQFKLETVVKKLKTNFFNVAGTGYVALDHRTSNAIDRNCNSYKSAKFISVEK